MPRGGFRGILPPCEGDHSQRSSKAFPRRKTWSDTSFVRFGEDQSNLSADLRLVYPNNLLELPAEMETSNSARLVFLWLTESQTLHLQVPVVQQCLHVQPGYPSGDIGLDPRRYPVQLALNVDLSLEQALYCYGGIGLVPVDVRLLVGGDASV